MKHPVGARFGVAAFVLSAAVACADDPLEDTVTLPPADDDDQCALVVEQADAWGPDVRVVEALYDAASSANAWAVVEVAEGATSRLEVRRLDVGDGPDRSEIAPREIEIRPTASRWRFVEGALPGDAWLERDRLDPDTDGTTLVQSGYDLWRLRPADPDTPVLYKPRMDQAVALPLGPRFYEHRMLVLDGFPFLFVTNNESTPDVWISFCSQIKKANLDASAPPPEGNYFCFYPVFDDVTLGEPLEAGPLLIARENRAVEFRVEPVSNLRSTGVAMLAFRRKVVYTGPLLEGATPFDSWEVVTAKLRAIGGYPVIPSILYYTVLDTAEPGVPLEFAPVRVIQDAFHAFFHLDERKNPRDGRLAWTNVLAYDSLPEQTVEEDLEPGAIPFQLAGGASFLWVKDEQLWLRPFDATGADPDGFNEIRFAEPVSLYRDPDIESVAPAGPGHAIVRHTDGRDALVRITCE